MKKIISINYLESTEQAVVRPQTVFKEMDEIMQIDCLNDAIYDLENIRDELIKKIYPRIVMPSSMQ